MTTNVHLVGSVALDTAQDVFATAGKLLGPYLKRVPDGEPGGRRMWNSWQISVLRGNPGLQAVLAPGQRIAFVPLKLAEGVTAETLHFGELGYAREARASYLDFLDARQRGDLPAHVRFQVSLPTPMAVVQPFCIQPDAQAIQPRYQEAMLREVGRICDAIPHQDLAIQWDVCSEMVTFDGRQDASRQFPGMAQAFAAQFAALGGSVPENVELGFHLCYGDLDGVHFFDPIDTAKMVELAHLIVQSVPRPVTWLHMPVPIDRDDEAFFAPLRSLHLAQETELYLGVVHAKDGIEGTRRRMAAARRVVSDFGIASECGISRARTPEVARQFLEVYAEAARSG